jgi:endonuclease/exonuclease/phosphatase family metal-dependent hydrolase
MEPDSSSKNNEKKIYFHSRQTLPYGKALYLTGSHPRLGSWTIQTAIRMQWESADNWITSVELPEKQQIEYKFFSSNYDNVEPNEINWEAGSNRVLNTGEIEKKPHDLFKVISFNIRYDNPRDYPRNGWLQRRDSVVETIKQQNCDIVAFQEAMPHMTDFIKAELGEEYDIVIRGRDWNGQGESTCFLYKKNKFILIDYGFFWLSDTPYVPGTIYKGTLFPRIVTWGLLREPFTRRNLMFVNNHYEHMPTSEKVRLESTLLLKKEIQKIMNSLGLTELNTYIIITGDFNAGKEEKYYKAMLTEEFSLLDSSEFLDKKEKSGTFHNFSGEAGSLQIDFIFYNKLLNVERYSIIKNKRKDGLYPSDHFPITVDFKMKVV